MSRLIYCCFAVPLLIPPVVFAICALAEGLSAAETLTALGEQFLTKRQNLLMCGTIGLFPVLLLLGCLWIHRRVDGNTRTRREMGWSGLIAIALVLIWVNVEFWPLFFPGRTDPGFPHGLEFLVGPALFAPIAMLFGIGVVWWARRPRR
jgi:hypothetical protein